MKSIKDLKDKHKGKRCFVMGTGPSLQMYQLDKLRDEITIAPNGIVHAIDETGFHPTYFCTADHAMFEQPEHWECVKRTESIRVISDWILLKGPQFGYNFTGEQRKFIRDSYLIKHLSPGHRTLISKPEEISLDLEKGTKQVGTTILDVCIPLAFCLGCDPVYIIGCDCQMTGHFYKYKTPYERKIGKGVGMADMRVRDQYPVFKKKFDQEGRTLINLTPIDVSCPGIPKKKFDDII